MAQVTVNLPITSWGFVDSNTTSGVIDISGETEVKMRKYYGTAGSFVGSYLFLGVSAFPNNLSNNRIYSAKLTYCFRCDYYLSKFVMFRSEAFDPATLEWNNKPTTYTYNGSTTGTMSSSVENWTDYVMEPSSGTSAEALSTSACELLRTPYLAIVNATTSSSAAACGYAKLYTLADDATTPYLQVTYDDAEVIGSQITTESGPTSGYCDPRNAITFAWSYDKDTSSGYDCVGETFTQSSATLYWKETSDANYTAVTISGSTLNTTIAANTFPTATTIEWYLEGTDTAGTTSQTDVYTFSTAAGTVTTTPVEPVNQVIDGTAAYTFSWTISSTDGQSASRTVLQYSTDSGTTWTDIFDQSSHITSYTVAAGTFSAGSIDWRVKAYNIDGTLGTYTSATFICIAAPDAVDGLSATAVPFSTISWQSDDQQAYQITVDGEVIIKAFGADTYSYTLTEPLTDGQHTISVIVQGQYGLWSQESTTTITIANVAPTTITLTGEFDEDVLLEWVFGSAQVDNNVRIYRDGTQIATVADDLSFQDRMVLGEHSYYILKAYSTGYYAKSNIVTGTMSTDATIIAELEKGTGVTMSWLSIGTSENSDEEQLFDWTRTATIRHVGGTVFPDIEMAIFEDITATYNCAFDNAVNCSILESLRGKPVIVKSRRGNVMIGVMTKLTKRETHFYTAYSFSLQMIRWEDVVNA